MSTVRRTVDGFAAAAIVAFSAVGCRQEQEPTPRACSQPGAVRTVPLKAIRVLHTTDTPGAQNNKGCRLTNQQIQRYIAQAQDFYRRSCHISLTWDGQINDLRWNLDDTFWPARDGRSFLAFLLHELQDDDFYSAGHLNIYFHGNLKFDTTGDGHGDTPFNANTIDPSDEAVIPGTEGIVAKKHILVNDRGGINGQGRFESQDGVLEHELAHWFLRQRAGQGGRYNAEEHAAPNSGLIMQPNTPHPDTFIEDAQAGICERFEIWTQAENWNNP